LLLLVGTIIFSNKAKNNVDLTYLKYFIDLDQVHTYAWGAAALAFLYRELTNATIPSYKYVAGYMTLLQTWIYNYFVDIRGSLDTQYEQQYPRATKYDPTKGQSSQMAMRKMMDQLLPHDITWTPYKDHRDVCPFKDITLYSDWIGCGPIKVRYLPERVLRQFGYMETIPRHPDSTANILDTVYRIDQHWLNYTDRVLTYDMLGSRSTIPSDIAPGYMSWYFRISHPYIVCISTSLMQPMPVESDAAMLGILASIRYILNSVMHKDEVPNDSRVYNEFKYAYTLTFVPNQGGPGSSSQS
ncbi:serine/threonine-protein phosphatase 7 long form-like protein, partial [Trifolium pratense]